MTFLKFDQYLIESCLSESFCYEGFKMFKISWLLASKTLHES